MDSSAIKFDRVEIAFILALFHWPKPLTDEGGEKTGVPRENPRRIAYENATYKSPSVYVPAKTPPALKHWWQALTAEAGAGIMEADDRPVTTVFTVQQSFHHRHSTNRIS